MDHRLRMFICGCCVALTAWQVASAADGACRELEVSAYRDRLTAGWIGQIAGVSWGAPTEFKYNDMIVPEEAVPKWTPDMINQAFGQDDLYVEMTFLRTLEQYGFDVPIRQAGIDFANSRYGLACANLAGRNNLRSGVAPPDCSHPRFNKCPNDIDYQIEADYSGLIAPGMPNVAIKLGEKFGRLMNYGDGVYGGQFMGGMYAAAYFESDRIKVIEAGLACIPAESQYAEMVRDMLAWYRENPSDWQKTWHLAQKKYRQDPKYQKASNGGIDVKINGAYVLMGLLYGEGDPERTIVISMRCGQDSDCNPSSAAGVLFTMIGASQLPARFTSELDQKKIFNHTAYDFPGLIAVCEKLTRQTLARNGGRISKDGEGREVFHIPLQTPKPSELQLSWAPGPIANSLFTKAEMDQITVPSLPKSFEQFAPGWHLTQCGPDMNPGLQSEFGGRTNVFMTHPESKEVPCILWRDAAIPAGKQTTLRLLVGHYPAGDWLLVVKAEGEKLREQVVGPESVSNTWLPIEVDLSRYAGRTVKLELLNQANGWSFEAGYWAEINLVSQ